MHQHDTRQITGTAVRIQSEKANNAVTVTTRDGTVNAGERGTDWVAVYVDQFQDVRSDGREGDVLVVRTPLRGLRPGGHRAHRVVMSFCVGAWPSRPDPDTCAEGQGSGDKSMTVSLRIDPTRIALSFS